MVVDIMGFPGDFPVICHLPVKKLIEREGLPTLGFHERVMCTCAEGIPGT